MSVTDETEAVEEVQLSELVNAPSSLPAAKKAGFEADSMSEKLDEALENLRQVSGEKAELEMQLREEKANNQTRKILDELIKPFAGKTYWFMVGYCVVVGMLVFVSGFDWGKSSFFSLEESTLNFLVGSTATAVIGLAGMVLTGIFIGARK